MAEYLYLVESDCIDETREKEFNDWYENIHVPDSLQDKCFIKATRCQLASPIEGKPKYLVIYEIQSDDLDNDMRKHMDIMIHKKEQGRISDLLNTKSRFMYKKISYHTQ